MGNNTRIQLRYETASDWSSENPTLASGEMGIASDVLRIKVGDGVTTWNNLSYINTGAFKYGMYTLSATQTSNIAVGNHIELNTSSGSLGGLSTGAGQANGIITLSSNKTYKITGSFLFGHSAAGWTVVRIYDRTNSTYLGIKECNYSGNYNGGDGDQPSLLAIVAPSTNIDIDVRFVEVNNTNMVSSGYGWLLIEEYGGY